LLLADLWDWMTQFGWCTGGVCGLKLYLLYCVEHVPIESAILILNFVCEQLQLGSDYNKQLLNNTTFISAVAKE
jgi:hypothetical protein